MVLHLSLEQKRKGPDPRNIIAGQADARETAHGTFSNKRIAEDGNSVKGNKLSLANGEVTLPSMGIDPAYAFKYGEAEAEAAEKKIEQRKADIRDMIQRNSFMALQITKKDGRKEILSRSVRPGVAWQLTYYGSDGEPTMHENYGRTGTGRVNEAVHTEDELYTHFANMTLRNDLKVETLDDVPDGEGMRYSVAEENEYENLPPDAYYKDGSIYSWEFLLDNTIQL